MTSPPSICASVLLAAADAACLETLRPAAAILESFGIKTSALAGSHDQPMPPLAADVCAVIVASPDAALPAALATRTALPVIRVPTEAGGRRGVNLLGDGSDNLPAGTTEGVFATMAIGEAGAKNAALFVVSALAATDEQVRAAWNEFRTLQTEAVRRLPGLALED